MNANFQQIFFFLLKANSHEIFSKENSTFLAVLHILLEIFFFSLSKTNSISQSR